jgi:two-component system nitrate/nitrite response regulator NarL
MKLPDVMNAAPEPRAGRADGRPSLLIADDDAVVRATLSAQLASAFRVIATAENATDAIALATEHRPDAALIDVDMPGGGARAAVPQIAAGSPGTCMVILSADESRTVVLELLAAGAIAYVRKGVTAAQISQTLTDALNATGDHPPA